MLENKIIEHIPNLDNHTLYDVLSLLDPTNNLVKYFYSNKIGVFSNNRNLLESSIKQLISNKKTSENQKKYILNYFHFYRKNKKKELIFDKKTFNIVLLEAHFYANYYNTVTSGLFNGKEQLLLLKLIEPFLERLNSHTSIMKSSAKYYDHPEEINTFLGYCYLSQKIDNYPTKEQALLAINNQIKTLEDELYKNPILYFDLKFLPQEIPAT